MKNVFQLFLLLCFLSACADEPKEIYTSVFIRLRNTSSFEYTDVYVNTSGGEFTYGAVSAKSTSLYQPFESAYSYAYVSLKIDGIEYKIQPIDYFGEKTLENGVYTYEISAKASGGHYDRLMIRLVKD